MNDPLVLAAAVATVGLVAVFGWMVLRRPRLDPDGRSVGPRPVAAEHSAIEKRRQRAVDALGILDSPAEDRFDHIVTMARQLYGTESAVFSVIDRNREWHKSRSGNTVEQAERSNSFCSVTIRGTGPMVIGDASADDRFSSNAAVTSDPGVRFYAGIPIRAPGGEQIGALCVYDPSPRVSSEVDEEALRRLGHLIESELRVSRRRR